MFGWWDRVNDIMIITFVSVESVSAWDQSRKGPRHECLPIDLVFTLTLHYILIYSDWKLNGTASSWWSLPCITKFTNILEGRELMSYTEDATRKIWKVFISQFGIVMRQKRNGGRWLRWESAVAGHATPGLKIRLNGWLTLWSHQVLLRGLRRPVHTTIIALVLVYLFV